MQSSHRKACCLPTYQLWTSRTYNEKPKTTYLSKPPNKMEINTVCVQIRMRKTTKLGRKGRRIQETEWQSVSACGKTHHRGARGPGPSNPRVPCDANRTPRSSLCERQQAKSKVSRERPETQHSSHGLTARNKQAWNYSVPRLPQTPRCSGWRGPGESTLAQTDGAEQTAQTQARRNAVRSSLAKKQRPCNGPTMVFSANCAGTASHHKKKKITLNTDLSPFTKINSSPG